MSETPPDSVYREIDLLAFLAKFGPVSVIAQSSEPTMTAKHVKLPNGNDVIFVERSYRDGLAVIESPVQQHLEALHNGKVWDLWNSEDAIFINPTIIDTTDSLNETPETTEL